MSEGGFGGLGIGNPGSYGGAPSVGAPGFGGGYADIGGYDIGKPQSGGWANIAIQAVAGIVAALATGSIPVGLAVSRIAKKVGEKYADQIVSWAQSGEYTPADIADRMGKDFQAGVVSIKPMTEAEAIDAFLDSQGYFGPERHDMERNVKRWLQDKDGRHWQGDPNIPRWIEQIEAAQDPETYKNNRAVEIGGTQGGVIQNPNAPKDQPQAANNGFWGEPTALEKEIASLQLNAAREFSRKTNDPRVLQDIYRSLPTYKMSNEDRARFTEEYGKISQQVEAINMEQAGYAMGQRLDDMVARGVISQESADKQKIKNEAALNTVLKIANKKLDAARIGMARNQYTADSVSGLKSANVIAEVDQRNRQIYNNVISQALGNIERKRDAVLNYSSDLANAGLRNKMVIDQSDIAFNKDAWTAVAPVAGDALRRAMA